MKPAMQQIKTFSPSKAGEPEELEGICCGVYTTMTLEKRPDVDNEIHGIGRHKQGDFRIRGLGNLGNSLFFTASSRCGDWKLQVTWSANELRYVGETMDEACKGEMCYFVRKACRSILHVSGAESVAKPLMGTYTRMSITGSTVNGTRSIYQNTNGKYLYYRADLGVWCMGPNYDTHICNLYARGDTACPTFTSGWNVFVDGRWRTEYSISIDEASEERVKRHVASALDKSLASGELQALLLEKAVSSTQAKSCAVLSDQSIAERKQNFIQLVADNSASGARYNIVIGHPYTYDLAAEEIQQMLPPCPVGKIRKLFFIEDAKIVEDRTACIPDHFLQHGNALSFNCSYFEPEDMVVHLRSKRMKHAIDGNPKLYVGQLQMTNFSIPLMKKVSQALREGQYLEEVLIREDYIPRQKWSSKLRNRKWNLSHDGNSYKFKFRTVDGMLLAEDVWDSEEDFIEFWVQFSERSMCNYCLILHWESTKEANANKEPKYLSGTPTLAMLTSL